MFFLYRVQNEQTHIRSLLLFRTDVRILPQTNVLAGIRIRVLKSVIVPNSV